MRLPGHSATPCARSCRGRHPRARGTARLHGPRPGGIGGWIHFAGVGFTALAATAAAIAPTIAGARRRDGRTVLLGTAFTVMAALLALHGLATPGIILGYNGLVGFTGAATLPIGGAVLARALGAPGAAPAQEPAPAARAPDRPRGRNHRARDGGNARPAAPEAGPPLGVPFLIAVRVFAGVLFLRALRRLFRTLLRGGLRGVLRVAIVIAG